MQIGNSFHAIPNKQTAKPNTVKVMLPTTHRWQRRICIYYDTTDVGLMQDVRKKGIALVRRQRQLTLDELVAKTLLRHPIYWDWDLRGYTSCEAVLQRIVEVRDALQASGGLEKLRLGFLRR